MPRTRRIVAGVSASPGNLPALRHAAAFGRLRHGRVSRYCLAHAGCPVIAVPSPALNRAAIRARHARVPD
jgi:hypothetical protein